MKKNILIVFVFLFGINLTFAQNTSGILSGTVTAQDGVIVGATVKVTDDKTGREKTVVTGDDGGFTIPQLEYGDYTVTITAQGYKTNIAKNIKVSAAIATSVTFRLEVGEVKEEVNITAGGEMINSSNAQLATSVSAAQIRDLPLNGRNPISLVNLQAGANGTSRSISGQRSSSTSITRDGINIQDNYVRTGLFVADRPSVDDISEITVITQNAGVEQGGGASIVQLITPRGGKAFHGNLYINNRNSAFTANSWYNNWNNVKKPFLNLNQFGGSLGGTIPIFNFGEGGPVFLKNKFFFFTNYEGYKLAQQVPIGTRILLPAARNGNFTYLGRDGLTRTVNVLTGEGFDLSSAANQTLFQNAGGVLSVDPIIQSRLLSKVPTVGNGITTGLNYTQALTFNRSNGADRKNFSIRTDLDINTKNSLYFIYKRTIELNDMASQPSGYSIKPFVRQGGPTNFFSTNYRFTPNSNFTTEFIFGGNLSSPFFNESNVPTDYLISQALFTNPEGSFRDQGRDTSLYTFKNNSVYSKGNHNISFGVQFDSYNVRTLNAGGTTPTYEISSGNVLTPALTANLLPNVNPTDLSRANILRFTLAGIVGRASVSANLISPERGYGFVPDIREFEYKTRAGYIGDQWRAKSNLTLNLGLRYEYYTPLKTPNPRYLEMIFDSNNVVASLSNPNAQLGLVGTNSGTPGQYFKPDRNNFAPSVGFAYTPKFSFLGKKDTVIRGGFSIRYVNDEYVRAASALVASNPGLGTVISQARTPTGQNAIRAKLTPDANFGAVPSFTVPTARTIPYLLSTRNAEGGYVATGSGVDNNLKIQQTYEWNLGIQRNIFRNTVIEARYAGAMSNSAVRTKEYNQIDIVKNSFLGDFIKAQSNCRLQGATLLSPGSTTDPINVCTSAEYNPAIPGSQQLTVFNKLVDGGRLTDPNYLSNLRANSTALLAQNYIADRLAGDVAFVPINNILFTEILVNGGIFRYNALQTELRQRFSDGSLIQVNYTFSKALTNLLSDNNGDQLRNGVLLDEERPKLSYGRADYDRTHVINANFIYNLPFGKGKLLFDKGGISNAVFGGWTISSIIQFDSGRPLGIIDPRSSYSRRNSRQSAISSLSTGELKKLTGIFKTPNGVYFMDPKVLFATVVPNPGVSGSRIEGFDLYQQLPAGYALESVRIVQPINSGTLPNQFLFFNKPGETGNLPINFINGTPYFNWDLGLRKNFKIGEKMNLRLQVDGFNVLNQTVYSYGSDLDIGDTDTFGRIFAANSNRVIQFGARFDF